MPESRLRPLSDLPRVLPELSATLSVSRAQLVIDQLTALVEQRRGHQIMLLTCDAAPGSSGNGSEDLSEKTVGCVVVYHPEPADFATILLAGGVTALAEPAEHRAVEPANRANASGDGRNHKFWQTIRNSLASELGRHLKARGVGFLQYATDVRDTSPANGLAGIDSSGLPSIDCFPWQFALGLLHLGDLEYQSGTVTDILQASADDRPSPIGLQQVDDLGNFTSLVERTYTQTLDCPRLARFRSAAQTLAGYQLTDAYAPHLWFTVHRDSQPVGCLIMGCHTSESSAPITEVVYMGLVPEVRGQGLGERIIHQAARVSQELAASRMILAVDETNDPARRLYRQAGLQTMMRETVWGRQIV